MISDVIKNRDSNLFNRITSDTGHVLYDLFPPKRNTVLRERGHGFILPRVKTERFKRAVENRCLLKFISQHLLTKIVSNFSNIHDSSLLIVRSHVCCD